MLAAMVLPRGWALEGDYYIPLRLQLLTRMIERETSRQMQADFNLSVAEWRVLALACDVGKVSGIDVIAAFEVDRAQVSRAVKSLLLAHLVQRQSASPKGKKMDITPTARGREVFEVLHARRQEYYRTIMAGLPPEALRAFDETLAHIARRVDEQRGAEQD